MELLNYHHLLYFWVVAREGGLLAAGRTLRLSHSTLHAQIHALEEQLGEKLFTKVGRKLVLTEMGHLVFRYADEIFTLGREMVSMVNGQVTGQPLRLAVGVVDAVPKVVVRRLLEPAFSLAEPIRIVCYEDSYEKLLADLAMHSLDIVLADSPVPSGSSVKAFSHLLGETGISFFATKALATKLRRGFPTSLDRAAMLLPLDGSPLRRMLNQWFERKGVKPHVVAEFEDSALLQVFGADGAGIFTAPTIVEKELVGQYGVRVIGRAKDVRERFYAVSVERRLKNPAVVAISDAARHQLFARPK